MSKTIEAKRSPQNLKDLRAVWSKAITKVDNHALTCKACNKPRNPHNFAVTVGNLNDPQLEKYRLCNRGLELYQAERAAMTAYREIGDLPAR